MAYYAVKNYKDRNGARTVIGGELLIKKGAKLTMEEGAEADGLPKALYMADADTSVSTVAALRTKVNALLAMLKAAGLMAAVAPTVTITQQATDLDLIAGAIDGDAVTVAAAVSDGSTPAYQWYSNVADSNAGGVAVEGATAASYAIPTVTTAGTYYYYCVASHEGVSAASNAVTVVVTAA